MRTGFPATQFEQEAGREGWGDVDLAGRYRAQDADEFAGGNTFRT